MKTNRFILFLFAALVSLSFISCDMHFIPYELEGGTYSGGQEQALDQEGRYLKITNLPLNTQSTNITAASVSNASASIARLDTRTPIRILKGSSTSTAYIPLIYNSGQEFIEEGYLFISLTIDVDVFTRISVSVSDRVVVLFSQGRGEFDITTLMGDTPYLPGDVSYLTIINLPSHIQRNNITNVFVLNQAGRIGRCINYSEIIIEDKGATATVSIPIVYMNSTDIFEETGAYFVSFDLNIDALTRITITENDKIAINFLRGNAVLDITLLGGDIAVPCLTIINLPFNTQKYHFSDVFVFNAAGRVAKVSDYNDIIITKDSQYATAIIPLAYNNNDEYFRDSGIFAISFSINIDFATQIKKVQGDAFTIYFTDGNALLDASQLPLEPPPPYLTIMGLPRNTVRHNFSNVFLYNNVGVVARCANYSEIVVTTDGSSATAKIPLVYSSNSEYFRDSGVFIVAFTVYIDILSQIVKVRDDGLIASFTAGSGLVNLADDFGFFSGGLTNPNDTLPPIIRRGTSFELNGSYFTLNFDTPVNTSTLTRTSLAYIYAAYRVGGVVFEYSTEAPVYDSFKRGYYSGDRRALFKLIFIRDAVNQFFAKTLIDQPFNHLQYATANTSGLATQGITSTHTLSGAGNPAAQTVTLTPGGYIFALVGAGGGNGGNLLDVEFNLIRSGSVGGVGGAVTDVITITQNTDFSIFTGQGGSSGGLGNAFPVIGVSSGGGGGGSGTFVYSLGYFVAAGGGGGAGGCGSLGSRMFLGDISLGGGGGGAGGAAGAGAGGGGGAFPFGTHDFASPGGGGGGGRAAGGGGGFGNQSAGSPGGNGNFLFGSNPGWGHRGAGGSGDSSGGVGGNAATFSYAPPLDWQNTNNASGQGGNGGNGVNGGSAGGAGQAGGNNRNTIRGGGAAAGGAGSIVIYKIF